MIHAQANTSSRKKESLGTTLGSWIRKAGSSGSPGERRWSRRSQGLCTGRQRQELARVTVFDDRTACMRSTETCSSGSLATRFQAEGVLTSRKRPGFFEPRDGASANTPVAGLWSRTDHALLSSHSHSLLNTLQRIRPQRTISTNVVCQRCLDSIGP